MSFLYFEIIFWGLISLLKQNDLIVVEDKICVSKMKYNYLIWEITQKVTNSTVTVTVTVLVTVIDGKVQT